MTRPYVASSKKSVLISSARSSYGYHTVAGAGRADAIEGGMSRSWVDWRGRLRLWVVAAHAWVRRCRVDACIPALVLSLHKVAKRPDPRPQCVAAEQ